MPGPDPERDRRLAAQPRYRYRSAQPLGEEIADLLDSEAFRRLRRFQRVNDVLRERLPASHLTRLKPVRFQAGVLHIDVRDGPLLAELRQHHERALLAALASAGTGVTQVRWRLARSLTR